MEDPQSGARLEGHPYERRRDPCLELLVVVLQKDQGRWSPRDLGTMNMAGLAAGVRAPRDTVLRVTWESQSKIWALGYFANRNPYHITRAQGAPPPRRMRTDARTRARYAARGTGGLARVTRDTFAPVARRRATRTGEGRHRAAVPLCSCVAAPPDTHPAARGSGTLIPFSVLRLSTPRPFPSRHPVPRVASCPC